MALIRRLFVEKKENYDIEAQQIYEDIKNNLKIDCLEKIRILNRYDIEGISDKVYEISKNTIFSEPPVDNIYEENFECAKDEYIFAVEYLPGQYDQRADSAMQCIQIITGNDESIVSNAKVYILKGNLNDTEINKIKKYCINPVDSREASLLKPESLSMNLIEPEDVIVFDNFIDKTDEQIIQMKNELSLAMSNEDLIFCREYFKNTEKRNPTETEIKVIDTYWSDHCRHTTFSTKINNIEIEDGFYKEIIDDALNMYNNQRKQLYKDKEKNICLMDIAVIGMKALKKKGFLNNLDESDEINACSIVVPVDVDGKYEDWLIMFKNETHNHPTEIEPFGGAATCLGGAIRDPLSGRSYVYQAMRVTGSGNPLTPISETIDGKLPQRKITISAAHGYSSYGNQIGLATGQVTEIYDDGYVAKRMEIGAVIGAVKKSYVKREKPSKGDVIILVGGRTGRDGCGGATGSSKEHDIKSILNCGAEVQKGNPLTERKLQKLFRRKEVSKLIKKCNDFGAGGVSVAIGELSDGLEINLDKVPKKYKGLNGTELAISESQERMAVVVASDDAENFIKYSNEDNLEATIVAYVTNDRRLKMLWRDKTIVNISRDFLDTNGVTQNTDVFVKSPEKLKDEYKNTYDLKNEWINNLKDLNVACQKGLSERFDSTIGTGTVIMPFGGKKQLTPIEAMAAKIPVLKGKTNTATLMAFGYNPNVSNWSPFHGAVYAVIESISKIVATGGEYQNIRLTFQEYFEKLGKEPEKWGKPFSSLLGAFYSQMKLNIPSIGGKDSMSGTFIDKNVPPTLVCFAVDVCNTKNIISPEFKKTETKIIILNTEYDKFDLPIFDKLIKNYIKINELIKSKKVISASTIGIGGICAAISKMCFGNMIGIDIKTNLNLFKYNYGSFILEVDADENDINEFFNGLNYTILGKTINDGFIKINNEKIDINEALKAWIEPLESVFPTNYYTKYKNENLYIKPFNIQIKKGSLSKFASPRVVIPVFPGTNCEVDTLKAFEKAGALVQNAYIKNLKPSWLKESIDDLSDKINNSQIIMLPGGFSAGDEPEGSGKFIAAVFRSPKVKDAVMNLIKNRDGLILGICNGFQVLMKLGLLPYGEIIDINDKNPTLTFNSIGRHVSCLTDTKIISNKSPWLWKTNVDDIHTIAVSHGEGRFVADNNIIRELIENNQIAAQYVDKYGNPTYDMKYNPNGSIYSIESITSLDGRILGKMGHSERIDSDLYKNVPGNKYQYLFESGVEYFK